MMKISKNKILVTGGATGTGLGLTERFVADGNTVIICGRRATALNTDLGGKGLHDQHPSVSDFIKSIFDQLHAGKTELTFGTSEARAEANNATISEYFSRMNP